MRAGLGVLFDYLFVCCPGAPWLHDRELEVNDGVPCRSERADGIKVATENVFLSHPEIFEFQDVIKIKMKLVVCCTHATLALF